MGPMAVLNHLLNFVVPAIGMAMGVTLGARLLMPKRLPTLILPAQFTINFIVSASVLGLGLLVLGRDGKMASYAAMALACATSQWLMARGWRR